MLSQLEDVQLSRFLVCMEASDIPFRLLLNKADLVSEEELSTQVSKVRCAHCLSIIIHSVSLFVCSDCKLLCGYVAVEICNQLCCLGICSVISLHRVSIANIKPHRCAPGATSRWW